MVLLPQSQICPEVDKATHSSKNYLLGARECSKHWRAIRESNRKNVSLYGTYILARGKKSINVSMQYLFYYY